VLYLEASRTHFTSEDGDSFGRRKVRVEFRRHWSARCFVDRGGNLIVGDEKEEEEEKEGAMDATGD
jgi:hypothetical protein